METSIYYFSGTGNSLAVARRLAVELGDTELRSIPQVLAKGTRAVEPKVGLVFPVYVWGLPRIVADFVRQLKFSAGQYIFAVATCGGTPGGTLLQLRSLIRKSGEVLAAGFVVCMPNHTPFTLEMPVIGLIRKLDRKPLPLGAEERLAEIADAVRNQEPHEPETSSALCNLVSGLLYVAAIGQSKKADRRYWIDTGRCKQCGTCTRVCPRGNITLENGRVSFHHDCEQCLACFRWCPQHAVCIQGIPQTETSVHNTEVTLKDMMVC